MKGSSCVFILVIVVLLSFGWPIKPSYTPDLISDLSHPCRRPELLLPLLNTDRYNGSYPCVDYEPVLNRVSDFMLQRSPHIHACDHRLYYMWSKTCLNEDPQNATLNILAREVTRVLHEDESRFEIAKRLLGDRMGTWLMNPPNQLTNNVVHDYRCIRQKKNLYEKHCGELTDCGILKHFQTFDAMCILELVEDLEFADAAEEICKKYTYSNPL